MSFYATMQGQVQYLYRQHFDEVVKLLQDGLWMDEYGFFLDECGGKIYEENGPNINHETLVIDIPYAHHRNMSRVDFFVNDDVKGIVMGTSTDGCFCGWIITDGTEKSYDLEKWAKDNLVDPEDAIAPKEEDYKDSSDHFQNLIEWQAMVEQEFHSDFG